MALTLQEMLELSVQEILDLEREARGSAFIAIMWYQDYGRAKAYLGYADALAEYAAHIKECTTKL